MKLFGNDYYNDYICPKVHECVLPTGKLCFHKAKHKADKKCFDLRDILECVKFFKTLGYKGLCQPCVRSQSLRRKK